MLKDYKLIRISRKNAEVLDNAGKKNETYNEVLTEFFLSELTFLSLGELMTFLSELTFLTLGELMPYCVIICVFRNLCNLKNFRI